MNGEERLDRLFIVFKWARVLFKENKSSLREVIPVGLYHTNIRRRDDDVGENTEVGAGNFRRLDVNRYSTNPT